ncbi:hypothetical protein MGG_01699 [Pyricularia oryzae 70-15]|uniref:DNA repair protein rhp42 n=3 Tax=Pyricularia oryzae TaxID=318829 RepID=G4MUV6_PYRO7|nr:uncharacterized protein MGG_01699 [Pyricularia oryzae 70-15]EHA54886.1 hypothetical protein MGG_01699 [Pyricularia oryzae 70-15]ELQ36835.1 DNA repair protein rhp41 [Pyricularia oryzae Y34]KAI7914026.1 hypothetical protein M0657_009695 [Pyricularia oryzae]KAI7915238.1 hypothetical protein M9X92_008525 [Pyricularia oryzae]
MPPRKRLRDASLSASANSSSTGNKRQKTKLNLPTVPPRKATLFDSIDTVSTPGASAKTRSPADILGVSDEDDSSLSSLSDEEFKDVVAAADRSLDMADEDDDGSDDDDDDIEFEDVQASLAPFAEEAAPSGDLELTLDLDGRISLTNEYGNKKGPSKRERITRNAVHRVHVMFLMWHNAVRNSWLCDAEVQGLLLSHVPPRVWEEYERWRRASALDRASETPASRSNAPKTKGKGKGSAKETARPSRRDWGDAAQRLENGTVDMSHGDPLFRLMKALSAWWKQRFRVTAPGLRKVGYMSLERLDRLTKGFKNGDKNTALFGERIGSLDEFRLCAQSCTGSRDVGAQLFTALLRGLGLEARMIASLQPLGYGWSKYEDADPEEERSSQPSPEKPTQTTQTPQKNTKNEPRRQHVSSRSRGKQSKAIEEEDSNYVDDFEPQEVNSDDEMVVEVPKKMAPQSKKFDQDLEFPHYWTEVLSPVTHKYLAVDPVVKFVIATNRELVESLEPRGSRTEKARQVMAYIMGFSSDGTAKDVTVRYLKRQMLPGRTKGVRYPIEKVPVYNHKGKVKHYEHVDWIKSVLRGYVRGNKRHPITEVDEEEDSTDLRPAKHEKKEVKEGDETLQYYKQSKEYVLERHLKREEALLQDATPVKVFKVKAKGGEFTEENVYLRRDVVQVKSAETWHKQGRAPKEGEKPLKMVPYRAATMNRKRDIAAAEAATGKKVLQGLYSMDQTDWIIPPPIKDGIIPKNEYGNIDLFAEHMCPQGAVHVPFRGAVKVCRRLGVDYAEAVIDFEFGHRMAVPVIQGVVIAEEHHDRVMEELAKDEAERARKEDAKRTAAALAMWRKMLMAMRITNRLREEYGNVGDGDLRIIQTSRSRADETTHRPADASAGFDEDTAGGFLPAGYECESQETEDKAVENQEAPRVSSYFPVAGEDDEDDDDDLVVEDAQMDDATSPALAGGSAIIGDTERSGEHGDALASDGEQHQADAPVMEEDAVYSNGSSRSAASKRRRATVEASPATRVRPSRQAAKKAKPKLKQLESDIDTQ